MLRFWLIVSDLKPFHRALQTVINFLFTKVNWLLSMTISRGMSLCEGRCLSQFKDGEIYLPFSNPTFLILFYFLLWRKRRFFYFTDTFMELYIANSFVVWGLRLLFVEIVRIKSRQVLVSTIKVYSNFQVRGCLFILDLLMVNTSIMIPCVNGGKLVGINVFRLLWKLCIDF